MIRFIASLIPAAFVTLGLLLLMHFLIQRNMTAPEDADELKIPDITMAKREVEQNLDETEVDKPEEVEEPPPDLPEPELDNADIDNSLTFSNKVEVEVDTGINRDTFSDGSYLPIVKVQPKYPSRAQAAGTEGECTVSYTVTVTGETKDIKVHDCPKRVFVRTSIKAAAKFKYKPKVVDGVPIEVPGVLNVFRFKLDTE